jgi:16S rRNA (cytidine1402-2'-O)-methyltransferase
LELAARLREPPKGEITIVFGPGHETQADAETAAGAVGELIALGVPRRQAADVVARLTGLSRNELYRRTL